MAKKMHQLVAQEYEKGRAINEAETLEFDEVIDPLKTRNSIATAHGCFNLNSKNNTNSFIDSW